MKLEPTLKTLLQEQTALVYTAHSLGLGMAIWTKKMGWAGSHKWFGRFSEDKFKTTKGILKVLTSYYDIDDAVIPAVSAVKCLAKNFPDSYAQVFSAVRDEQEGWIKIAAEAEKAGDQNLDDFADGYMEDGREMIKRLSRFTEFFDQVGDNTAAWVAFDWERR